MRNFRIERGQVSTEWLIVTAVLMAALFIPIDGDQSAVAMFVQAVKDFHANSVYSLSLP